MLAGRIQAEMLRSVGRLFAMVHALVAACVAAALSAVLAAGMTVGAVTMAALRAAQVISAVLPVRVRPELALHEACASSDAPKTCALLAAGANVNHAWADGVTALMAASRRGHANCARLLLKAGADVNHAREDGTTASMLRASQAATPTACASCSRPAPTFGTLRWKAALR
mmetsp:Transcript_17695/g.45241  ORF Transcript_17695/g.45241 Transcript_17695/m.45241 type:complete len:171 (+) Transcript_17695:52-564(+)